MASNLYNNGLYGLLSGSLDFLTDTVDVMLMSGSYTFNASQSYVSEVSSHEVSGTGYERKTLASKTITLDTGSNKVFYDAANPTYTALDAGEIASAVLFVSASTENSSSLLANVDFDDLTTNGSDVELLFSGSGIFAVNNIIT
jgi:hypothetical protein